jgi:hypothetical protein
VVTGAPPGERLVRRDRSVEGFGGGAETMTAMGPFVAGPPVDRSRPWRLVTDGSRSNGMALGDGRIAPGAPGPGRHVHTHEDEGIYVVTGVSRSRWVKSVTRSGPRASCGYPAKFRMCSPTSARKRCGLSASSVLPDSLACFVSRPSILRPFKVTLMPRCSSRSASVTESARLRGHRSFEVNQGATPEPAVP